MLINSKLIDYEVNVFAEKASGMKCERCWKISMFVSGETKLCTRCETVIKTKS